VSVHQAAGLGDGVVVIGAEQWFVSDEVTVHADFICAIFWHQNYSLGRSSPVSSLATSGERSGSSPAQSRHWNLRPPVLRSRNRMGLRHFGQMGGGVFFRMERSRGSSESITELTVTDDCRGRAVIAKGNGGEFNLSVRYRTPEAGHFVSFRMRSISCSACLIATARLTGVTPDLPLPPVKLIFHCQPVPSVN
jgi:hypothetical protein